MLKNLNELPEELQEVIIDYVDKPEFLYFIDMLEWSEETGLSGGGFAVMSNDAEIWKDEYKNPVYKTCRYLRSRGFEPYDSPIMIRASIADMPTPFIYDLSALDEGVDYRIMDKEAVKSEVAKHAVS